MKRIMLLFVMMMTFQLGFSEGYESDIRKDILLSGTTSPTISGGIRRAPIQQPVKAYICGELLTVEFVLIQPAATITISNQLTGEVEYTEICNTQSTVIDLSMLAFNGGGTYTIEVSTANWKRVGEFTY